MAVTSHLRYCPCRHAPYLFPVEQAGGEEIDGGLEPQSTVFEGYVAERCTHARDAHVAVQSEGGREQPRHVFPERRHGGSRPRDAGQEQQRHGEEDEQHDAVLTPVDEGGERHAHEDARQQVRHEEGEERGVMSQLRKPERMGDECEHVYAHQQVKHEVENGLAQNDLNRR